MILILKYVCCWPGKVLFVALEALRHPDDPIWPAQGSWTPRHEAKTPWPAAVAGGLAIAAILKTCSSLYTLDTSNPEAFVPKVQHNTRWIYMNFVTKHVWHGSKAPATPFAMDLTLPSQEMRWALPHRGARLPQHVHLSGPMWWMQSRMKFNKTLDRCTMVHSTTIFKKVQFHGGKDYIIFTSQKKNCWNFLASWLRFRGFLPCFNCLWEMRFSPWPGSSRQCDVKTEGCQEPRRWAVSL